MTTTLIPRVFGDFFDWFDVDRPQSSGHMIRVEDSLTDQEYHVRAELPGLDPASDIDISVDQGTLTIHAEREERDETKGRTEFRYGALERSVRLPANAETDNIKATYDKGILDVAVPLRSKETASRKIEIEAG
ncbi:Hsp20/alpha crystallin family protein [Luedemannella helvata]|uniref:Hsp20/alpha crystallin family protein n=1 Tax=Luedemannella helvata TaxID=349315 RepID=A0ABP4WTL2_9ACTN